MFQIIVFSLLLPMTLNAQNAIGTTTESFIRVDDNNCTDAIQAFAESSGNFSYCAILNAHPITVCENCVSWYIKLINNFRLLFNTSDSLGKCNEEYLDLDRLQVIRTQFGYNVDMWAKAQCDSCFVFEDGSITPEVTNDTKQFSVYNKDINECLKNATLGKVCEICLDKYLKFDYFYEKMKRNAKGSVCMDVVDMTNVTRKLWSTDLQCCKLRKHPEIPYLAINASIIAIAIIFYCFTPFFIRETSSAVPAPAQRRFADSLHDAEVPILAERRFADSFHAAETSDT